MNFRARLSLFALESRDTPSGVPAIPPVYSTSPPAVVDPTPVATAPTDPATVATQAIVAGATVPATTASTNPLLQNNSIYNVPLVGYVGG
jgi:hypothetical protein